MSKTNGTLVLHRAYKVWWLCQKQPGDWSALCQQRLLICPRYVHSGPEPKTLANMYQMYINAGEPSPADPRRSMVFRRRFMKDFRDVPASPSETVACMKQGRISWPFPWKCRDRTWPRISLLFSKHPKNSRVRKLYAGLCRRSFSGSRGQHTECVNQQ